MNIHGDTWHVNTDMLNPGGQVNVNRTKVESVEASKVSMMPTGLLDTFKEDEMLDLIAFLLSRGDRKNAMFRLNGLAIFNARRLQQPGCLVMVKAVTHAVRSDRIRGTRYAHTGPHGKYPETGSPHLQEMADRRTIPFRFRPPRGLRPGQRRGRPRGRYAPDGEPSFLQMPEIESELRELFGRRVDLVKRP